MKWLSYGWTVFVGLATLAITFAVVTAFESRFERVVIDLLILTYSTLQSSIIGRGWLSQSEGKASRNRFLETQKALGDLTYETEEQKEFRAEEEKILHRSMVKSYISSVVFSIMFLIAFVNLLAAL
jgi:hypothetical protein